jgi:glycosyltransferase involved in cell wall biosynthesis
MNNLEKPLHVLVNAASAHMGGSVTYLQNVLEWLPVVAPDDRFVVYLPRATREKLADLGDGARIQLEDYPYPNTGGLARHHFDQVAIPRLVARHDANLLFSSTGFGTWFSPRAQVLLVRNMAYFDPAFQARYRELRRSLRRNTLRRWHSLLSIRRADFVLFPTRAMRTMVEQYAPLNGTPSRCIHYGFDGKTFAGTEDAGGELPPEFTRWKAEGYHILLNVSTFAVQKNYETLVSALAVLHAQGFRIKLLTTLSREATTDTAEYDALLRHVHALGLQDDVVTLGYVPYRRLHALYRAADLYVFPSFTESFGHSLVEAMAAGLPVVAADTPVNREVCEEAGRYFNTFDAADCASAIAGLLGEAGERRRLASMSVDRAASFSWRRYVEELTSCFREAAQARRDISWLPPRSR